MVPSVKVYATRYLARIDSKGNVAWVKVLILRKLSFEDERVFNVAEMKVDDTVLNSPLVNEFGCAVDDMETRNLHQPESY